MPAGRCTATQLTPARPGLPWRPPGARLSLGRPAALKEDEEKRVRDDNKADGGGSPLRPGHAADDPAPTSPLALTTPYDAEILALAGPTLVALAADPLLSVVDTVFAGRLGPGELAAL